MEWEDYRYDNTIDTLNSDFALKDTSDSKQTSVSYGDGSIPITVRNYNELYIIDGGYTSETN